MYTVIIVNKRTSDFMQSHRFLFEPFIRNGELDICDWNEGGTDVNSSIPDLYKLIRGKRIWRALILNTDSLVGYHGCAMPKRDNPYDFSDLDDEIMPHESPIPLIRLTHILGGYASAPQKSFEKGFEYVDQESGEIVRRLESELSLEDLSELSDQYGESLKAVYMEKPEDASFAQKQAEMAERYTFDSVRPREIMLVSTRQKNEENDRRKIVASWLDHLETGSSSFWERNKYPNCCRFMFCEISRTDNARYEQDVCQFWLAVLTLALNQISPSSLQAYRLYKLSVDLSMEVLQARICQHLNLLESAKRVVNDALAQLPEYDFATDEQVLAIEKVPLVVETKDDGESPLEVKADAYVKHDDTLGSYATMRAQSQKNLARQMQNPRRGIDRAAKLVRSKAKGYYGTYCELDEFQIDDLKESVRDYELKVFTTRPKNIYNKKKTMEKGAEVVRNLQLEIPEPMTSYQLIVAGVIALVLVILGNLTYLVDSYDAGTLLEAFLLTVAIVLVTAIGGIVALKWHQSVMEQKISALQKPIRDHANEIQKSNALFEDYFTNVCTYMKGRSMLIGTQMCDDDCTTDRKRYSAHLKALSKAIERDQKWLFNYDIKRINEEKIYNIDKIFDVNELPINNKLYWFEPNEETDSIVLNATGDTCNAPYKFVTRLYVEREEIFDDAEK